MDILLLVLAPILWVVYSIFEGIEEGYIYNYRDSNDLEYSTDLHGFFTKQRLIFAVLLVIALTFIAPWYLAILAMGSLSATFPLIHDGYYYITRNNIDNKIYPTRFKTNKNTSTAKFSLESFIGRLALASVGIVGYIGYILLFIFTP